MWGDAQRRPMGGRGGRRSGRALLGGAARRRWDVAGAHCHALRWAPAPPRLLATCALDCAAGVAAGPRHAPGPCPPCLLPPCWPPPPAAAAPRQPCRLQQPGGVASVHPAARGQGQSAPHDVRRCQAAGKARHAVPAGHGKHAGAGRSGACPLPSPPPPGEGGVGYCGGGRTTGPVCAPPYNPICLTWQRGLNPTWGVGFGSASGAAEAGPPHLGGRRLVGPRLQQQPHHVSMAIPSSHVERRLSILRKHHGARTRVRERA